MRASSSEMEGDRPRRVVYRDPVPKVAPDRWPLPPVPVALSHRARRRTDRRLVAAIAAGLVLAGGGGAGLVAGGGGAPTSLAVHHDALVSARDEPQLRLSPRPGPHVT